MTKSPTRRGDATSIKGSATLFQRATMTTPRSCVNGSERRPLRRRCNRAVGSAGADSDAIQTLGPVHVVKLVVNTNR